MAPVLPSSSPSGRSSVLVIQMPPTKRPGASRWSGSNWSLTRRIRSSAGIGPHTSSAGLDVGGRVDDDGAAAVPHAGLADPGQGGLRRLDARAGRQRGVRDTGASGAAHVQPAVAGGGEHVAEAGEGEGQLERGGAVVAVRPHLPRVRRSARRRVLRLGGVARETAEDAGDGRGATGDAVLATLEQHVDRALAERGPLDLHRGGHGLGVDDRLDGVVRGGRVGDPGGDPATGLRQRVEPEDGLGHDAEGAEGADEQLAEVVAGDVLDHAAAGLGDHAVGAHDRQADEQVAGGADRDPAGAAGVGRERAADAGAGHGLVEGQPLAALGDGLPAGRTSGCRSGRR